MNEKILVVHPGYSKTGTTSFQHLLKSADVNILAKPYWPDNQAKIILYRLFREHLYNNEYQITKREYNYFDLKNNFKDYLKNFFKNNKKVSVFSDEGMLMLGRMSVYFGIYNLYIIKDVIEEIENELHIKIIIKFVITIRKQHNIILSSYFFIEEFSKYMSLDDFLKKFIQTTEYKNLFDYTLVVKKIIKIFNSEILILPLELLEKDKKKYIDKFSKFIDMKVNIDEKSETIFAEKFNEKLLHMKENSIIKDGKKRYS